MHYSKVRHPRVHPRYGLFALVALLLTPMVGCEAVAPAATTAASSLSASVSVETDNGLGVIPPHPFGVNTAVWDSHMNDRVIPSLLKAAGITAMRYPGGSWSDIYDWRTNTVNDGQTVAPNTNFSDFMRTAQSAGAIPIITVDYGTGTPALAADWVRYANVIHDYGITYWEVGNEVYGNGFYGDGWEHDNHSSKSPNTYAANFLKFQSAMLSVDPNVRVCTVLTLPGNWPAAVIGPGDTMNWNDTVLSIVRSKLQCVIVHDYPNETTAATMLTQPDSIPNWISALRSEIRHYARPAAASAQILTTETDSNGVGLDSQPGALFTADTMMLMLQSGSVNVDYWDEHNGGSSLTYVDGTPDYDDDGLLSDGSKEEPRVNTPFAPYYAIEMLSKLAAPGDKMVASSSTKSMIKVHAVRTLSGGLNILIENENPHKTYTISLRLQDFVASAFPVVYTFKNDTRSISRAVHRSSKSITVAPYSLTVLQILNRSGGR